MKFHAEIGVIGGSGFYSLLKNSEKIKVKSKYGKPSSDFTIGEIFGKSIAFLPRHGERHKYPPHKIPFKANIDCFKELGVKFIIAPCACGSLQPQIKPGDFVICDQFIDRTWGRDDTFFHGPEVTHISIDHPYCNYLRDIAIKVGKKLKYNLHKKGTVVIINGPRFSTKAESEWYQRNEWDVINMTQYPEVVLAREAEIAYVGIALVTDYDTGVAGMQDVLPVTLDEVIKIFNENNKKVKKMIYEMIKEIDPKKDCSCHTALKKAIL